MSNTVKDYEENIKYLLDNYKDSVRVCYKGLDEDLITSLCTTFIKMQDKLRGLVQ